MQHSNLFKKALIAAALGMVAGVAQSAVDESAAEAFKKVDADGDGYVTVQEADTGLISKEIFMAADTNKDGKLDIEEFTIAGLGMEKPKTH